MFGAEIGSITVHPVPQYWNRIPTLLNQYYATRVYNILQWSISESLSYSVLMCSGHLFSCDKWCAEPERQWGVSNNRPVYLWVNNAECPSWHQHQTLLTVTLLFTADGRAATAVSLVLKTNSCMARGHMQHCSDLSDLWENVAYHSKECIKTATAAWETKRQKCPLPL